MGQGRGAESKILIYKLEALEIVKKLKKLQSILEDIMENNNQKKYVSNGCFIYGIIFIFALFSGTLVTSSFIGGLIFSVVACVIAFFIDKSKKEEFDKKVEEILPKIIEEEEIVEAAPKLEFNKKEIQSQKDQSITELKNRGKRWILVPSVLISSFVAEMLLSCGFTQLGTGFVLSL